MTENNRNLNMEDQQYPEDRQSGLEEQRGNREGQELPQRSSSGTGQTSRTSNRGFASMNPEKQREIASKGGKAAHQSGHAHEWNSEQAREAGRKGGQASGSNRTQK